jgi:hypothetical protein
MRRFTNKEAAAERERKNAADKINLGGREVQVPALVQRMCKAGIHVRLPNGKDVIWRLTEDDIRRHTKQLAELKQALLMGLPLTSEMRTVSALVLNWMIPVTDPRRDAEWRNVILTLCQMWELGTRAWDAEWNEQVEEFQRSKGLRQ